jgi:uncharacterized protein
MRQFVQRVVFQLLRAYKWAISPMFPPACRYVPTCSEYAMEAVERYGAVRGGLKALTRLARCHPFAHGGYDPVVKRPAACEAPTSEAMSCEGTTPEAMKRRPSQAAIPGTI